MYYWLLPTIKNGLEAGDEHKLANEIRMAVMRVMKVKRRDVTPHKSDTCSARKGRPTVKIAQTRMYIAYLLARHTTFVHREIAEYAGIHRTTVTTLINTMRDEHLKDERVQQTIKLIESKVFNRKPAHE